MQRVIHSRSCEVAEEAGQYSCSCSARMDDAYDREMEARVDRARDRWVDEEGT